ncbi:MAG: phosphatidate cytidylyltransferase [Thermodesulfovibrionales bacterium]|nr:phosphatidate cytidylyltransferase [Thermodesulfovibrionales bacterium]
MHLKRLIIAAILLPLIYFYITKLPAEYFLFLLVIAAAAAQYEFYSMYNVKGFLRYAGIGFGAAVILCMFFSGTFSADLFVFSFLAIVTLRLFLRRNPSSAFHDAASVVTAVIYIPWLLGYQLYLRENGSEWIIFLYGCVWASDSLAYYIGKGIGRRKLYEEISPNKTIAGAVGSIAGGMAGAVILKIAVVNYISLSLMQAAVLGMMIGIVTIIGDLAESMFKRDAGVKDSSSIVPGHGGILDKIDSVLFAGPVFYWASMVFGLVK